MDKSDAALQPYAPKAAESDAALLPNAPKTVESEAVLSPSVAKRDELLQVQLKKIQARKRSMSLNMAGLLQMQQNDQGSKINVLETVAGRMQQNKTNFCKCS